MAIKHIIGNPTPRVEGEDKVTGRAIYAVDVALPGMLWGRTLRSPISYGRIRRIDIGKALEVPGVKAVVTGRDVQGLRIGRRVVDMPILAEDVVRFTGEKVAAVAADSEEIADQALDLIEVDYEDLEPLLDPLEALRPSAPLLHPDVMSYKGLPNPIGEPSNAFVQISWKKGEIEAGFRQSDVIVENVFRTQVVHQAYIEPHSCVVKADASGGAEIWSCSKVPFAIRQQVAAAVQVPLEKLIVHPCYIGGDFGGKGDFMDVALCYVLSRKSGHPVKMVMDYGEEFIAGNPRHASVIRVKTGVKKDGRLMAHHMEFVFDSGAYGAFKPVGILGGASESAGPYRIPHVLLDEKIVYTNKIPCGHMRAPGDPQGFFANESHMDLVAKKLGLDPVAFRRMNLLRSGDESAVGHVISHIKGEETLKRALDDSGYYSRKPKNVGRGLALAQWMGSGGECRVFVRIDRQGVITLSSAVMDQGSGTYTLMRQIVAEELKVPVDAVNVESLDTTQTQQESGIGGSRATRIYGHATYDAATRAREALLKIAGAAMGASPEQLLLANGGVIHAGQERRMSFAELVEANGSEVKTEGHYKNLQKDSESSMCAQVAEIDVDPETGEVKVRRITTAHDTGTILNPLMHQGQIEGGVVMGMGYAVMEHLMIADGKVHTANFGDYKIPTIQDIPDLKTAVTESAAGGGPYKSMTIGETSIIPLAAAIANAVEDAVGVRIQELPITAEKVLAALNRR